MGLTATLSERILMFWYCAEHRCSMFRTKGTVLGLDFDVEAVAREQMPENTARVSS